MEIIAKCWNIDHWVKFKLIIGEYDNLIAFLNANGLSFMTEAALDFENIPLSLHGRNNSKNLLEYIANNVDNPELIFRFVSYFINGILNIRYESGKKLKYHFDYSPTWQIQKLSVSAPYTPPTTTLAPTTTAIPTTTLLVEFQEP